VQALKKRGIRAETITSAMTRVEKAALLSEIRRQYTGSDSLRYNSPEGNACSDHPAGSRNTPVCSAGSRPAGSPSGQPGNRRCRLLYVSPERLLSEEFCTFARSVPISFICVDEAHCVSQWGRDFRPAYRKIPDFVSVLPKRPVIAAFTATATAEVKSDIIDSLMLDNPVCLTTGFNRENLFYEVRRPKDKWSELRFLLKKYRGECGIIYCLTRRSVDALHAKLAYAGIRAAKYHGGMTQEDRNYNQEAWLNGRTGLIVATNAFGMGIDKADVRFVIHYNMPANMENYYQEAGRAGRDGLPSDCILLYSDWDITICRFFISRAGFIPDDKLTIAFLSDSERAELRRIERERLRQMQLYAGHRSCLRGFMLEYFGEHAPKFCGKCSYCLSLEPFADRATSLVPGVVDQNLYKELRALRKELADKRHVFAHKIVSTTALRDMALVRPTTFAALLFIREISLISAFRYGKYFLRDIRTWVATH
jgi:ATP-dependent DNA helicase RecQ